MFPNAEKGVKKLFKAEIFALIAAVIAVAAAVAMIIGGALGEAGNEAAAFAALGAGVLIGVGAGVLLIVAFVLNLVSLLNAQKDDRNFTIALYFTGAGIASSLLTSVFAANGALSGTFTTVSNVASLFTTLFVINGIMSLAGKLNDEKMVQKGKTYLYLIVTVHILSIVAGIIGTVFRTNEAMLIAAGVLMILSGILEIVAYFLYLSYLAKAKKMLR